MKQIDTSLFTSLVEGSILHTQEIGTHNFKRFADLVDHIFSIAHNTQPTVRLGGVFGDDYRIGEKNEKNYTKK